jgi:membrane-bound lytic murein transglycosylase D
MILGLLLCVVILVSFFPMTWKIKDDEYIKGLEGRIEILEKKLAEQTAGASKPAVAGAEKKSAITQESSIKAVENAMAMKINLLSGRVDGIQEQVHAVQSAIGGLTVEKQPVVEHRKPVVPIGKQPVIEQSKSVAPIAKQPKVEHNKPVAPIEKTKKQVRKKTFVYHVVDEGDTFYSISRQYGISLKRLKDLNGFTEQTELHTGEKIIVGP